MTTANNAMPNLSWLQPKIETNGVEEAKYREGGHGGYRGGGYGGYLRGGYGGYPGGGYGGRGGSGYGGYPGEAVDAETEN